MTLCLQLPWSLLSSCSLTLTGPDHLLPGPGLAPCTSQSQASLPTLPLHLASPPAGRAFRNVLQAPPTSPASVVQASTAHGQHLRHLGTLTSQRRAVPRPNALRPPDCGNAAAFTGLQCVAQNQEHQVHKGPQLQSFQGQFLPQIKDIIYRMQRAHVFLT